jgi:GNAT superfamily N-acetyltransferase
LSSLILYKCILPLFYDGSLHNASDSKRYADKTVFVLSLTISSFPPIYGIGSILFPVRNLKIENVGDQNRERYEKRIMIEDSSEFFVDSFWTSKVGGGSKVLTSQQKQNLLQSQIAEFNKRYGSNGRKLSELIVCRDTSSKNDNNIIGCVGIEVDRIPQNSLKGPTLTNAGPLMSNLATSSNYRRRGIAKQLIESVEQLIVNEWGYDECFLYVEERNSKAIQLYKKLGYLIVWKDMVNAKTLMPTVDGDLLSIPTTLICMRKDLTGTNSLFNKLLFRL